MKRHAYKLDTNEIFGVKRHHYIEEIDNALHCRGKYKDAYGLISSNIVLYINGVGEQFISKTSIYIVLETLIAGKDEVDYSGVFLPSPPREILIMAKTYIDNFNKK